VPTARELAKNDRDRALIEVLEAPYALSRPYAAPPAVPADRAKALQEAFRATHKDPGYLADAAKLSIDDSRIGGDGVVRLVEQIPKTPEDQLRNVEKLISEGG